MQIPLDNLTENITPKIVEAIKLNKGTCKVKIELFDFVNNYRVETISAHKVVCSNALKQLRNIPGINIKVKA
jgi:hypothetical protein